jgi:hypothetical protein
MSYHNTSSPTANAQRLAINAQGQSAPAGYHYMLDGTLMSDAEHGVVSSKVIRNFDLDLSDLPYTREVRQFTISGDNGAQFILEIKSGSNFYNFTTNTFQATPSRLEVSIGSGGYKIVSPFQLLQLTVNTTFIFTLFQEQRTLHIVKLDLATVL